MTEEKEETPEDLAEVETFVTDETLLSELRAKIAKRRRFIDEENKAFYWILEMIEGRKKNLDDYLGMIDSGKMTDFNYGMASGYLDNIEPPEVIIETMNRLVKLLRKWADE